MHASDSSHSALVVLLFAQFIKYAKLYPALAWSELKFLSMDRDQLALGMLKWTKNPIHNSLTQIAEEDKVTQKLAKEMFKVTHTARATSPPPVLLHLS
jgi:hypothetical protein